MEKYTYEKLIKEGAEQVKQIYWPNECSRSFNNKERAFAISENHGEYDLPWIIILKNGKETERINIRFIEIIEWA